MQRLGRKETKNKSLSAGEGSSGKKSGDCGNGKKCLGGDDAWEQDRKTKKGIGHGHISSGILNRHQSRTVM